MKKYIVKLLKTYSIWFLAIALIGSFCFYPSKSQSVEEYLRSVGVDPNKPYDDIITIVDTDGSVYTNYVILTPQNGPGTYISMPAPQFAYNIKALDAFVKAKNANGGYLAPGGTYHVPGAGGNTTKSSTPATPKTESKKEEAKCEHEYSAEVTTEPTCKDKGVKTFTCTKCGDTYTEEIDVVNIHTFDESKEEVIKEATCTEDGISAKVCKICGYKEESSIPKLEHQYKEKVTKEATCTEKGVKTFTCELCSDSYTEDIDELGHTEGQFEVTKPNGLFSDGEQIKKCTVCNEVLATEVIPAKYPIWYLYCGIGVIAAIIIAVAAVAIAKKKKTK